MGLGWLLYVVTSLSEAAVAAGRGDYRLYLRDSGRLLKVVAPAISLLLQ